MNKGAMRAGKDTKIVHVGPAIAVDNDAGTFYTGTNGWPHAGCPVGGGALEGAKLAWRPQTMVAVGEGDAATLFKLIDALADGENVQTALGN